MNIKQLALDCRAAAQQIAALSSVAKNGLLHAMADTLLDDSEAILAANSADLHAAQIKGVRKAMLDRLRLDKIRLDDMARALQRIAELPDPVGRITRSEIRPNGLRVERMRVPLGVIAMIYEARPNVTADAAALCLKAGNGVILRGGSEAIHSNRAIAGALRQALRQRGLPTAAITLLDDLRRESILELIQLNDIVDLVIPRGGEGLIRFVVEHSRIPVIKHYKGVCHLYVDAEADPALAQRLLIDGKTTRPGVCNALETLLVHTDIAAHFLPTAAAALFARGVELRGDPRVCELLPQAHPATNEDYAAEYLDLVLAVRVVDSLDSALAHIHQYGSDHTEVIATQNEITAQRFVHGLHSAVVMVNASSRFSDGGELGLGAEIGISTTRLHAYGPMGAESLTIERFVVHGEGQVRHPQSVT
ncbi:MAG TPA: glutamate-5-semialdehyde dehydrogenase [Mizugakiibacter sp.]|nr:glutamate-5-semialdehyde dehydrogenase [Mizugakiibacter sp.]